MAWEPRYRGLALRAVLAIGIGLGTVASVNAGESESEAVTFSGPSILFLIPENPCGAFRPDIDVECTSADVAKLLRQQAARLRSRGKPLQGEVLLRAVPKKGIVLEMPPLRSMMQIDWPVTLFVCPPTEMRARAGSVPDDALAQELAGCVAADGAGRRTRG